VGICIAVVWIACTTVGSWAATEYDIKKLTETVARGGPTSAWLYEDSDGNLCANTTSATDPCTNNIDMGKATQLSFTMSGPFGPRTLTDGGTTSMKLSWPTASGTSGLAGMVDAKLPTLLDHEEEPMKSLIADAILKDVSFRCYVSIRKAVAQEISITVSDTKTGEQRTHTGKVDFLKMSMCYASSYKFNNNTAQQNGADCATKKKFEVTECTTAFGTTYKPCNKNFQYLQDHLQVVAAQLS
jgi:hypothetical protein